MKLYNIKDASEQVSFPEAVRKGIGAQNGLFFPAALPVLHDIDALLNMDFVTRSRIIIGRLIGDDLPQTTLDTLVAEAFDFPLPLREIERNVYALELFHGPTLAFKDFGARFMARILAAVEANSQSDKPITIVTATSGDTGAAVAHAFHNVPGIQVVILYPHERISELQEKMFCTLGGNIQTLAVDSDFDACQALVKRCFTDPDLQYHVRLNSANSINISRVLAQCLYYFEAIAQVQKHDAVVSVPSGNFGNLTAGLMAYHMGLPVKRFIAATNANDTVPRYLTDGTWQPRDTIPTLSNAMDVSAPNNWPRIEEISRLRNSVSSDLITGVSISDAETEQTMQDLYQQHGYIADPHSAIAYAGLKRHCGSDETGIFLCTAHPAKFKQSVDTALNIDLPLPAEIQACADKPLLSHRMANDYQAFKDFLLRL